MPGDVERRGRGVASDGDRSLLRVAYVAVKAAEARAARESGTA